MLTVGSGRALGEALNIGCAELLAAEAGLAGAGASPAALDETGGTEAVGAAAIGYAEDGAAGTVVDEAEATESAADVAGAATELAEEAIQRAEGDDAACPAEVLDPGACSRGENSRYASSTDRARKAQPPSAAAFAGRLGGLSCGGKSMFRMSGAAKGGAVFGPEWGGFASTGPTWPSCASRLQRAHSPSNSVMA